MRARLAKAKRLCSRLIRGVKVENEERKIIWRALFGKALGPEVLGEELYSVFLDRLREIAGAVVNETIEYWLKGLADGLNGMEPELCVEFPYLEHNERVDALTMDYCVDNEDGTRTRLHRIDLRTALTRHTQRMHERTGVERMLISVVAAELRALAHQIESGMNEQGKPIN